MRSTSASTTRAIAGSAASTASTTPSWLATTACTTSAAGRRSRVLVARDVALGRELRRRAVGRSGLIQIDQLDAHLSTLRACGQDHYERIASSSSGGEGVHAIDVDGELDDVAAGYRAAVDDAGHEAGALVHEQLGVVVLASAGGGRDGLRRDARRLDAEEQVALGAELFDGLDLDAQPRLAVRRRAGQREVARPDAEDHAPLATRERRGLRQRQRVPGERGGAVRERGLDEVHRGRADEGGDEEVDRASKSCCGVAHCCRTPSRRTATRWPSVIASTWSCVT